MAFDRNLFLPVTTEDMKRRGWEDYDFLVITGDAYVDHPSFGTTIIARVLEAEGFRVPSWPNRTGRIPRHLPLWVAPGWR